MALDGVKNFAIVTVSTGYDDTATSIVLATSEGAKLPDPATANFNLVWWDSTNYSEPALDPNVEIVRCTAKSTDTLTVIRAQESTSGSTKNTVAATYKMALTVTAKMITDIGTDLDAKVTKALFDANTILAANSDNTPAAVTIAEQKVLGRATGGNITALDIVSDLSSVSANDDTIPSAKATKSALDGKKADSVSAASRILGRKTSGAGAIEELTLSEVMDFIGSAASGDILYRGASAWARLPKGTNGQVLTLASDIPSWANASGGGSLLAVKSANETITNSQTYQDDDHLTLTVEANSNYFVELNCLFYINQNDNMIKIQFVAPSGSTIYGMYSTIYSPDYSLHYPLSYLKTSFEINTGLEITGGVYYSPVYKGYLSVSSTGGTFKLQWALSSGNSSITFYKGSFLRLTKL